MTETFRFPIILADPPWQYRDRLAMPGAHGPIRGASSFYPTMKLSDIMEMPVSSISARDSVLFLWVTMPMLPDGLAVVEKWGFEYKTVAFTWIKRTRKGKIHFGMGHYTRSNVELCLLGVRGKLQRRSNSVSQVIEAPIGRHSAKPEEIFTRIELLYGDLPRVELFARSPRPGWTTVGYEIDGTDVRHWLS